MFFWCVEHKAGWLTAYAQSKVLLFEVEAGCILGLGTKEGKNNARNRFVELI